MKVEDQNRAQVIDDALNFFVILSLNVLFYNMKD